MPWLLALFSTSTPPTSNWITSGYGITGILAACVTLIGAGIFAYKVAQRRGVDADEQRQVRDMVLPDKKTGEGGVQASFRELNSKIDALARNQTPNGGDTKSLGDTVQRIEGAVEKLSTRLDQHIGAVNVRLGAIEQQVREVKKVRENRETRKPLETQDPDKTSKKRRYTVQIEALKSAAAADALKERLNKKGYKASVISSVTKKHEKLFKVFVGEFAARKEAEVMSVKLKKTENLQRPFVTFRSE